MGQLSPVVPDDARVRAAVVARPVGRYGDRVRGMASDRRSGVGKIVQFVRVGNGRWVKRAEVQVWIS